MTPAKQEKVFNKFGLRCAYCGYKIYTNVEVDHPFKATIDHVIPKASGGTERLENLLPVCFGCNHVKDDMNLNEFRNALLTGKASKKGKDNEVKNLKTPRYMIPYGKYTGVKNYIWGGRFYFEKKVQERKNAEEVIDMVQPVFMNGSSSSEMIDEFMSKTRTLEKNGKNRTSTVESVLVNDSAAVDAQKKKRVIIVTNDNNKGYARKKPQFSTGRIVPKAAASAIAMPAAASSRSKLSKTERKDVYKAFHWRCALCGCMLRGEDHDIGHSNACISKIHIKGDFSENNVLATCQDCQSVKLTFDLEEFRTRIFTKKTKQPIGIMKAGKTSQLQDTHFVPYFENDIDHFYFELSDGSQKDSIDAFWKNVIPCDMTGKPVVVLPNDKATVSEQTKTSAEITELCSEDYPVIASPLVEEYNNLFEIRKQLMDDLKDVENKLQKLKTAIDALHHFEE